MSEERQGRPPRAFSVKPEAPEAPEATPKTERTAPRKPRAISEPDRIELAEEDYFASEHLDGGTTAPPVPEAPRRRGPKLVPIAASAFGFIVALALGLWFEALVRELFGRNPVLGQAALVAIGVLVLALIAFVAREVSAIVKLRSIAGLRQDIATALAAGNRRDLAEATRRLEGHFAHHPKTASGRARLAELDEDIIDAEDRLALVETELLKGLDAEARGLVMNAAKRVSIVTAVSPRALVDIGYVLYENVRLIRIIAQHYGGRTGTFGTIALVRRVITHLAVTGTIAIGDGLVQQMLGHGLAARLSARLGEGVVNGLMTARIGLAAIDVCRPAPFHALNRPRIGDFVGALTAVAGTRDGTTKVD